MHSTQLDSRAAKAKAKELRYKLDTERRFRVLRTLGTARVEMNRVGWDKNVHHSREEGGISLQGVLTLAAMQRCAEAPENEFRTQYNMVMELVWHTISTERDIRRHFRTKCKSLAQWEKTCQTEERIKEVLDMCFEAAVHQAVTPRIVPPTIKVIKDEEWMS